MKVYCNVEQGLFYWKDFWASEVVSGVRTYSYMFVNPDQAIEFCSRFIEAYSDVAGSWMLARTLGQPERFMSRIQEYNIEKDLICDPNVRCLWRRHSLEGGITYSRINEIILPVSADEMSYAQNFRRSALFHESGEARPLVEHSNVLFSDPTSLDVVAILREGCSDAVVQLDLEPDTFSIFYVITYREELDLLHSLIDKSAVFKCVGRDEYTKLFLSWNK
jgi:hypothetical protein